ncbi:MAG: Hsp20/alpha crystallin family protein [Dissulfurimicrobium sp.]|uniref:Hsp20/alpha crystallin family protein n=1 Tax=Dissulfurimicrobium sp. TaxID=2022436 RepID=UPI00404B6AEE
MTVLKIKIKSRTEELDTGLSQILQDLCHISMPIMSSARGWIPSVDICKTQDTVYIVADIPGVDTNSLYLAVKDHLLYLSGNRLPPWSEGEMHFYQMEIIYGRFERVIRIPSIADTNQINASYENGLLLIKIPCQQQKIKIDIAQG